MLIQSYNKDKMAGINKDAHDNAKMEYEQKMQRMMENAHKNQMAKVNQVLKVKARIRDGQAELRKRMEMRTNGYKEEYVKEICTKLVRKEELETQFSEIDQIEKEWRRRFDETQKIK